MGSSSAVRLADKVLEARKKLGLSQGKVIELSGLGRTTYRRIEKADGGSTLSSLDSLAKALGCHPYELLKP